MAGPKICFGPPHHQIVTCWRALDQHGPELNEIAWEGVFSERFSSFQQRTGGVFIRGGGLRWGRASRR